MGGSYLMPGAVAHLGTGTKVRCMQGGPFLKALSGMKTMIPACNVRLQPGLAGVMRAAQETGSALMVEAAMSEVSKWGPDASKPKQGYSGMNPDQFARFVIETADQVGFTQPLVVHVDHTTIQKDTTEAIEAGREQLGLYLQDQIAGAFSIDASFLPLYRNTAITAELARPIVGSELDLGLEVEVGEIGNSMAKAKAKEGGISDLLAKKALITTVWEAIGLRDTSERLEFIDRYGREPEEAEVRGFIPSLFDAGIQPHLLAIDNGSKHGNYKAGEDVSIFLGRTADVANAIAPFNMGIAQHGITGTPPELLYLFIETAGIKKGNIGTEWQNQAHLHMDPALNARMKAWATEGGYDIKHATGVFLAEIAAMEAKYVEAINNATYARMLMYIEAFRCAGTGPQILAALAG